jgi:hypothetical protein
MITEAKSGLLLILSPLATGFMVMILLIGLPMCPVAGMEFAGPADRSRVFLSTAFSLGY